MGILFGFRQIFPAIGLDLPNILVSNSIHVAKEIVLNSDAFALFSDLSIISEHRLGLLRQVELETPTQNWMQLILRGEQLPTPLMKSLVTEIVAVCKELGIESHADAGRFGRLRPATVTSTVAPSSSP